MTQDISHILRDWEFDPQKSYRRIVGDDGRQKVQVRVENAAFQGILQMDLDGRPDGKKPWGCEYVMDYYQQSLDRWRKAHGTDKGFSLDAAACAELFEESMCIYNRYVFMQQLQDYPRVVRDTKLNMNLFRFVNRYAEREKDRMNLEKWWPYILRINATARAMLIIREDSDFKKALRVVQKVRKKINGLEPVDAEEFKAELDRSDKALDELEKAFREQMPPSQEEKLQQKLEQAVAEERFEEAARLRDILKSIK
ncbi:MAG: UvrB/UvrC motif-containing protein [Gemmatimonadota bacterium]|nr:UvrB/UvrC motif-containing protein [Gemmatimonadota bacterium]